MAQTQTQTPVYERGNFWIARNAQHATRYDVFQVSGCASVRVSGAAMRTADASLELAKEICDAYASGELPRKIG